jgi:hypothetical protein
MSFGRENFRGMHIGSPYSRQLLVLYITCEKREESTWRYFKEKKNRQVKPIKRNAFHLVVKRNEI